MRARVPTLKKVRRRAGSAQWRRYLSAPIERRRGRHMEIFLRLAKKRPALPPAEEMLSRRRGLYAVGACVSIHTRAPNSKKAQRTSRPAEKGNVSCAGEGAIIATPLIVAILIPTIRVGWIHWPTSDCGMSTGLHATLTLRCCRWSCRCARRLRTGAPAAKPRFPAAITGGKLEALISVPHRRAMEGLSLCCSHHGGQGHYRHRKLAHCSLPLSIYRCNHPRLH
jgi:hypothetical protein